MDFVETSAQSTPPSVRRAALAIVADRRVCPGGTPPGSGHPTEGRPVIYDRRAAGHGPYAAEPSSPATRDTYASFAPFEPGEIQRDHAPYALCYTRAHLAVPDPTLGLADALGLHVAGSRCEVDHVVFLDGDGQVLGRGLPLWEDLCDHELTSLHESCAARIAAAELAAGRTHEIPSMIPGSAGNHNVDLSTFISLAKQKHTLDAPGLGRALVEAVSIYEWGLLPGEGRVHPKDALMRALRGAPAGASPH